MGINVINGNEQITLDSPYAGALTVAPADADSRLKAAADFVCDGVDDHIEINEALNRADRVVLLSGNFHISDTISVPRDKILEGNGPDSVTIFWFTTPILGNTTRMISLSPFTTLRSISIRGYSFYDDEDKTDNVDVVVSISGSSDRILIEDCVFNNAQRNIITSESSTVSQLTIRNCRFFASGKSGITQTDGNPLRGFIALDDPREFILDGCLMQVKLDAPIENYTGVEVVGGDGVNIVNSNFFFVNSSSGGSSREGITVTGTRITISGNNITYNGNLRKGIYFSGDNVSVSGNNFRIDGVTPYSNGVDIIQFDSCNSVNVCNNTFRLVGTNDLGAGSAAYAEPSGDIIRCYSNNSVAINNNTFNIDATLSGNKATNPDMRQVVRVESSLGVSVSNNTIKNSVSYQPSAANVAAILLSSSDEVAVCGNSIRYYENNDGTGSQCGIYLTSGTNTSVNSNTIKAIFDTASNIKRIKVFSSSNTTAIGNISGLVNDAGSNTNLVDASNA